MKRLRILEKYYGYVTDSSNIFAAHPPLLALRALPPGRNRGEHVADPCPGAQGTNWAKDTAP